MATMDFEDPPLSSDEEIVDVRQYGRPADGLMDAVQRFSEKDNPVLAAGGPAQTAALATLDDHADGPGDTSASPAMSDRVREALSRARQANAFLDSMREEGVLPPRRPAVAEEDSQAEVASPSEPEPEPQPEPEPELEPELPAKAPKTCECDAKSAAQAPSLEDVGDFSDLELELGNYYEDDLAPVDSDSEASSGSSPSARQCLADCVRLSRELRSLQLPALRDASGFAFHPCPELDVRALASETDRGAAIRRALGQAAVGHTPLVVRGALDHAPAVALWRSWDYVLDRIGRDTRVTVSVTPNGRADGPVRPAAARARGWLDASQTPGNTDGAAGDPAWLFITPHEQTITLGELRERLRAGRARVAATRDRIGLSRSFIADGQVELPADWALLPDDEVYYVQLQNGNIASMPEPGPAEGEQTPGHTTGEWARMIGDVPTSLDFMVDVFGTEPEVVNLWLGDARAQTSIHGDPYENAYSVITGQKTFWLYPPVDAAFMRERACQGAVFAPKDSQPDGGPSAGPDGGACRAFGIRPAEESSTSWVTFDPWVTLPRPLARNPAHYVPAPVLATLLPGDLLYLPALWYHGVQQDGFPGGAAEAGQAPDQVPQDALGPDGTCIAVNWWQPASVDSRWAHARAAKVQARRAGR
ncbi:hypothetical protein H696_04729 [Fonticula alba]|uniref:JmjC domain-containing protein n=1 Tax=Fonticula alba TaxID=691883 RepID=A0A058Z2F6_FONAL|nr:hypothetical protein H696_04729 [Fonticula alba]KCV68435.1 hypothetical protein H696_04729 [Fonticula alba]|eukprot:XP_009496867.1 hypothetical protein H696_04729 [Fonticula alba]